MLTGHAAAANAGPAIVLSFVLGGIACAFAGLCYAEMASTVPVAGSAYTYAYATLGELVAWIIGWDLILEYALGAVDGGDRLVRLRRELPQGFRHRGAAPRSRGAPLAYDAATQTWTATGALLNVPAMVIIAAVSRAAGRRHPRVGARSTTSSSSIKLAIIVVFHRVAAPFVHRPPNWVTAANPNGDFIPPAAGPGQFGWSGILRGAAVVFFAYIGFDAVSTAAQEAKNPKRDMPIGILGSLVICTVLYVAVGVRADRHRALRPAQRARPDRGRHRCDRPRLASRRSIKLGAILGLTSVVLVLLLGQARIFYAMAHDGLLPPIAARCTPASARPTSPRSSPASSSPCWPACCRSGWSANW